MHFNSTTEDGVCWISVGGRMDGETANLFDQNLQALQKQGQALFALDFKDLTFLNSRGLSSLIHLSQKVTPEKGQVVVMGLNGPVKEVFEAAQLGSLIPMVEDREAAIQFFRDSGGMNPDSE